VVGEVLLPKLKKTGLAACDLEDLLKFKHSFDENGHLRSREQRKRHARECKRLWSQRPWRTLTNACLGYPPHLLTRYYPWIPPWWPHLHRGVQKRMRMEKRRDERPERTVRVRFAEHVTPLGYSSGWVKNTFK